MNLAAWPRRSTAIVGVALATMALAAGWTWLAVERRLAYDPAEAAASEGAAAAPSPPIVLVASPVAGEDLDARLAKLRAAIAANEGRFDSPGLLERGQPRAGAERGASGEIPPARRWQFYFPEGITATEYARQVDYFEIELGAVGGDTIDYVTHLGKPAPDKRTGRAADETRLYLAWHRGPHDAASREKAAEAGVVLGDKVLVHFLPAELEKRLAVLESEHAGRVPHAILRTRFGIRRVPGKGYVLVVVDQTPLQ